MNETVVAPDLTLLLCAEELNVETRRIIKSDVHVNIRTIVRQVQIKQVLTDDRIEIEHVPIGRYVDLVPPIRQEGDTTIISLVEEVIERRLILKEEIHLRKALTARTHDETVGVREERLTVERTVRPAPEGPAIVQANRADHPNPEEYRSDR